MNNRLISFILKNEILTAILVISCAWLIVELREIIISLFLAYILMTALYPYVKLLRNKGLANALAVGIPFVITIACIVLLIIPLIPFFIAQFQALLTSFPKYIGTVSYSLHLNLSASQIDSFISSQLAHIGENAVLVTSTVFSSVFALLTILVISFYLLLNHDNLKKDFVNIFPKSSQKKVITIIARVEEKLGAWVTGQILLSFSVGFLTWVMLTLVGLDFALPLALFVGLLEVIPTIGPIIGGIPAIIVALNQSPTTALTVAVIYILIQILENNILVPRIMEKAVGLNPLVIILGVIIGGKLLGITGALLSIPFISLLTVVVTNLQTDTS